MSPPSPPPASQAASRSSAAAASSSSGASPATPSVTRLAALDVGTNSIRLIVAEARADGSHRLLDDEKEVGRLGRGLDRTNRLSPKAMEAAALSISRMKGIALGYGVHRLEAVATAAVREAANRDEFLRLVRDRAGVDLKVISAEEEARLAFLSVSHAFDLRRTPAAVVDIGGGSTEIVLCSGGMIEQVYATPLGAVRLTEHFDGVAEGAERPFHEMTEHLRATLKRLVRKPPFAPQLVIGTGGTFTTLASVAIARRNGGDHEDSVGGTGGVRGYELQRSAVNHLLNWLRSMSPRARARVPGMSPERSEIIVAGVAIIDAVMQRLKVNTLRVHDRGIRDGLILSMIGEIYPQAGPAARRPLDRMEAVRTFARRCNYEQAHSDHVARLAVRVFDQIAAQLAPETLGGSSGRELLEAAGVLHDVGYSINYAKHHKHSYHLIVHSDLPGFTHREIEIIANVARYHRRAGPKGKHSNFAALSPGDQDLVVKLSAILRIVDGLDRAHAQIVSDVRVELAPRKGTAWFVVETAADASGAAQEPAVDMWGAARKSALFLKAFGMEPRFDWTGRQPLLLR